MRWIERELTQERDAARFKSTPITPSDRTARLYSHLFCPLLPQGRSFLGALGHFRDKPERGRKLASLARALDLPWPSPRAKVAYNQAVDALLGDLHTVVEEVLNGVVAVCTSEAAAKGKVSDTWRTLADTPRDVALHAMFLLFISPDYLDQLMEDLERYYEERFQNGEAPFPIKVRRGGEAVPAVENTVTEGEVTEEVAPPLFQRLKTARRERGLTQTQLAATLGVSQPMISYWEKGPATEKGVATGKPLSEQAISKMETWLSDPPKKLAL